MQRFTNIPHRMAPRALKDQLCFSLFPSTIFSCKTMTDPQSLAIIRWQMNVDTTKMLKAKEVIYSKVFNRDQPESADKIVEIIGFKLKSFQKTIL